LLKDWQIYFEVRGMIAPEKGIVFNDYILIRGVPQSDKAHVFFKVTAQNQKEAEKLLLHFMNVLRNMVRIYGLVADHYAEVLPFYYIAPVSSESPFGTEPSVRFYSVKVFGDEREKSIPLLEKTIATYEAVRGIFDDTRKSYLINAISYFCHALDGRSNGEKLIDFMIAMESLFSKEVQELRLRISLRAAFLLSIGKENERSDIFKTIYNLYVKRSKIVHGMERVNLSSEEVSKLRSYVVESIKRLTNIEQRKDRILELLDQAVYDENKRQELKDVVTQSLSRWET